MKATLALNGLKESGLPNILQSIFPKVLKYEHRSLRRKGNREKHVLQIQVIATAGHGIDEILQSMFKLVQAHLIQSRSKSCNLSHAIINLSQVKASSLKLY